MAGRGRGKGGRGGLDLSFNLDDFGILRGEVFSQSQTVHQLPLYPPLPRLPIPDKNYDPSELRMLEIKREMRVKHRKRSALLTLDDKKRDIERYSDKYQLNQQDEYVWTPDWSQFPEELRPDRPRKRRKVTTKPKGHSSNSKTKEEILANTKSLLETIPKNSKTQEEEEEEEKKVEEEEDEEEAVDEEEEEEEEEYLDEDDATDYHITYFDNGEGYGDDNDEDDEPAYNL